MSALPETTGFKPKKSVALSGTAAGNTALCTVGLSGNDLHYRGYDILDVATSCEFEEIAHLLVHGHLPNVAELAAYKAKLKALRGLPTGVRTALEQLPPSAHPMDVMRTAVSVLGCLSPEKDDHNHPGARDIADKLMACLGSVLLYWYHFSHNGKRIHVETDDDSIGGHFLHLLHGHKPRDSWVRAMHTSPSSSTPSTSSTPPPSPAASSPAPARTCSPASRGHRCPARAQARGRQRGGLRDPEALREPGRGGGRHSRPRVEKKRWSSASATRSTPSPIPATR